MTSPSRETRSIQTEEVCPFPEDESRAITDDAMATSTGNSVEYLDIPIRSSSYKKNHRAMKLANGLTAVLIADSDCVLPNKEDSREANKENNKEVAIKHEPNDDHRYHYSGPPVKRIKKEHKMVTMEETEEEDDDSREAECRLSIDVGNMNDPSDFPGLARFLEHVIAMGTDQYPQHFNDFVRNFGGWFNAYTGYTKTTFKIAVPKEFLSDVLQRLARFFVRPFIARESVMPVAPQFVTLPNYATDERLYDELNAFWQCRYRAHNMTIAIEANLELDTLEQYVTDSFSILSSDPLPSYYFGNFKATDLVNITGVQKVYGIHLVNGKNNKIEFIWTMPLLYEFHKRKPLQYISTILGHKGKGSLASYFQMKNWCLDVSCNVSQNRSNYSLVTLSLTSTNEGSGKLNDTVRTVHSYISMLRKEGPQKRIYDEIQKIEAAEFRYSDEPRPIDNALDLCENIHINSPANSLNSSEDCFEYDSGSIRVCLDALSPENGNIITFDKSDKSNSQKIEPWFKTKYTVTELAKPMIKYWKNSAPMPGLHLPEANAFLTEDFTLIHVPEDTPQYPVKIRSDAFLEVWHKPDVKLGLPKCYINLYYISPLPLASPENAVMLDIFVAVLKKLLFEPLYPANVAGLYYVIQSAEKGLLIKVSGYNEKLPLVLQTITKYIARCYTMVTEDLYKLMHKNRWIEYHDNTMQESLIDDLQLSIRRLVHWSDLDKFAATARVKFDRFQQFAKYFSDSLYVQCLVQGNMTDAEAVESAQKCIAILNCKPLLPNTTPQLRTVDIPRGVHYCRVRVFESETCSTVSNYYQFGGDSIAMTVMIELLNFQLAVELHGEIVKLHRELQLYKQLLVSKHRVVTTSSPANKCLHSAGKACFPVLVLSRFRVTIIQDSSFETFELAECTEICPTRGTSGVHGYSIMEKSVEYDTIEDIDNAIEMLRTSLSNIVRGMTDEDLIRVKDILISEKISTSIVMDQEKDVKRNWNEIISGEYSFDKSVREIEVLRELSTETMRTVMIHLTGDDANTRKLSVQTIGDLDLEHHEGKNGDAETDGMSGNGTPSSIDKYKGRKLTYMTALPNEKERPSDCYITDIESYKRDVMIVPVHGCSNRRLLS